MLQSARDLIEESKRRKEELKEEIDELNRKYTNEIENIVQDYSKRFKGIEDCVRNDYIKKQTEGFKLQKELMLLKRDKLLMEKKVAAAVAKLNEVEGTLYGRKIFDLETVHKELDNISDINLRIDRVDLMKNSQVIH